MQTFLSQKIQVLKFGGSSVKDLDSMRFCAEKVLLHAAQGPVVVVVSAAAGETNFLAKAISEFKENEITISQHESDLILTNGENISAGFFSAVLNSAGLKAVPMCGWQVPIATEASVITEIKTDRILKLLEAGIIPVITGFQGVEHGMITALVRGGSDITAVCLAKFLESDEAYIYTDVPGLYRISPKLLPPQENQIIQTIGYEDAYNLAANGAEVIHKEAVKIAQESKIRIVITSSFEDTGVFTEICDTEKKEYGIACAQQGDKYLLYILHNNLIGFEKFSKFEIYRRESDAIWVWCDKRTVDTSKFKATKAGFAFKRHWFKSNSNLSSIFCYGLASLIFIPFIIMFVQLFYMFNNDAQSDLRENKQTHYGYMKHRHLSGGGATFISDSPRSSSPSITRPARSVSSSGSRPGSMGRISGFRGGSIGRR